MHQIIGLAAGGLLCIQTAIAAPILWTLSDVTFDDGGTAFGSFVNDADTRTYPAIDITTTAGTLRSGYRYTTRDPEIFTSDAFSHLVLQMPTADHESFLRLGWSPSQLDGSREVSLNLEAVWSFEADCAPENCNVSGGARRSVRSGVLIPSGTLHRPIGPSSIDGVTFIFQNFSSGLWFDPIPVTMYHYFAEPGTLFTGVELPPGFGDNFALSAPGCTFGSSFGSLDFIDLATFCGSGISSFTVSNISPPADAEDPEGFPTRLTFDNPIGSFRMIGGELQSHCEIELNQATYINGETITADVFRLANSSPNPVTVDLRNWLVIRSIDPTSVIDLDDLTLPGGFDSDFGPIPLLPIDPSLPRGTWEYNCRLLDPVTGAERSFDRNSFEVQ